MSQDKIDALKAEYAKEREICSGANASEYHKKRFADLKKQLNITDGDGKVDKPKEGKKIVADSNATVEATATTATTASED